MSPPQNKPPSNDEPVNHLSDLRGLSRLVKEATVGVTDVVESMHHNISRFPGIVGRARQGPMGGISGLVYHSIRLITGMVGGSLDIVLGQLEPLLGQGSTWPGRQAVVAALNGVLGDTMAASENPLALSMVLRHGGQNLELDKQALVNSIPGANSKLLLLVHGLCMNDEQWNRQGHDHGATLARDLGYTPVYVRYNSGLHVSQNGRALAEKLETLVNEWPVPLDDFVVLGYSLGGQVVRSACHYAQEDDCGWIKRLQSLVFLGTPHHGVPLERGGNWIHQVMGISPYSAPLSRLGRIRSAGITDLRHGNLLDEEWQGIDRFDDPARERQPVPLPPGVRCHFLAATNFAKPGEGVGDRLVGDGMVSLPSALGRHEREELNLSRPEQRWVGHGLNHLDLLNHESVYRQIKLVLQS